MGLLTRIVNGTATVFGVLGLLATLVTLIQWVSAALTWSPTTVASALTWTLVSITLGVTATTIDYVHGRLDESRTEGI